MKTDYRLQKKVTQNSKGTGLIYRYFSPHWKMFLVIFLVLLINSVSGLLIPRVAEHIIDNNLNTSNPLSGGLIQSLSLIVFLAVLAVVFTYFQVRLTGMLGQDILYKVRRDIFLKLQVLPQRFFSVNKSGDIINRLTNDVEGISRFLNEGLIRLLSVAFNIIVVFVILFITSYKLAIAILVAMTIVILILLIQGNILKNVIKRSLDLDGNVSSQIQEILNGFRVIKTYGQEELMVKEFKEKNSKYFKVAMISNFVNSLSQPLLNFISLFTTFILILLSLELYIQGEFTQGAVLSYIVYVEIFFRPIRNIGGLWKNIQDGLASAQRIDEVLKLSSNIIESDAPFTPEEIIGKIEFKDVEFGYDDSDTNVLEKINFIIPAKKTVAIVGPTGGGKTTFVNLITRLYDVTNGQVLVDDVDVKDWKLDKLRGQIGYLLQDSFLFEDTILNNLRYGNESVSEDKARAVLNKIGALEFIEEMSNGLNTMLNANADNISAGQRQLISIARLMLRDPKILILDEATANIDTRTEKVVQNAIETITKEITSLVIAHRLSTIKNADIIILIQNNTVLESGSLEKLLEEKGEFYKLYKNFIGDQD